MLTVVSKVEKIILFTDSISSLNVKESLKLKSILTVFSRI